jgi:hypothetical protein
MPYQNDSIPFQLGTIFAFAEMVSFDVKKLALSLPFRPAEYNRLLPQAQKIARDQKVRIRLDKTFLTTDLFAEAFTRGKWVLLIYKHPDVLREYQELKKRKNRLIKENRYQGSQRKAVAVRMGRLLSYKNKVIQEKLKKI